MPDVCAIKCIPASFRACICANTHTQVFTRILARVCAHVRLKFMIQQKLFHNTLLTQNPKAGTWIAVDYDNVGRMKIYSNILPVVTEHKLELLLYKRCFLFFDCHSHTHLTLRFVQINLSLRL